MPLNELYIALNEHIKALMPLEDCIIHDEEQGILTYAEQLRIEMPFEMDIDASDENIAIATAPPLYYANTSIQPVYHSMKVTIVKTEDEDGQ